MIAIFMRHAMAAVEMADLQAASSNRRTKMRANTMRARHRRPARLAAWRNILWHTKMGSRVFHADGADKSRQYDGFNAEDPQAV